MNLEFTLNEIEGEWWFDLGRSLQRTDYHHKSKKCFALALGLATLYVRW